MPPHEVENQIGPRIVSALTSLRHKVYLEGAATDWHIRKAGDYLRSKPLSEHTVTHLEEADERAYREQLPELIRQTLRQNIDCQGCWNRGERDEFLAARARLGELFDRFQFRPKVYERLVRQMPKPALDAARRLLAVGDATAEVAVIERWLRLPLREFLELEESMCEDLLALDQARDELTAAYEWFSDDVARTFDSLDVDTFVTARQGLRKAAEHYEFDRGFAFSEYARWWIRAAVEKSRRTTPGPPGSGG